MDVVAFGALLWSGDEMYGLTVLQFDFVLRHFGEYGKSSDCRSRLYGGFGE